MEAKQNFIKQAYGDAWDKIKDYVDENGFTQKDPQRFGFERAFIQTAYKPTWRWRPSALYGLEENGGWTRCDEQIPHKEELYMVCVDNVPVPVCYRLDFITSQRSLGLINVTHWKILPKQDPPIY